MPTQPYYNAAGVKLPSVSTILGRYKESGGLMRWAYKTGLEHGRLQTLGKPCPRDLYDVSGRAADIGTAVHAMAEALVKGQDVEAVLAPLVPSGDEEFEAKTRRAFQAFLNWREMTRIEFVYTEVPMISEVHQCGGTLDWIGRLNGVLILGDHKTSDSIYSDYLMQVAAYREFWNELHPDEQLAPGAHILRFGKAHGDFAHHHYPELDSAWKMFRHLRAAYGYDAELKKRAA